jgi:non-ribosomal peptide synthetase component F
MSVLKTTRYSVGAVTPVKIASSSLTRLGLMVSSSGYFYIGGSDLDTSNGFFVNAGGGAVLDLTSVGFDAEMWALSNSGTTNIDVLEINPL